MAKGEAQHYITEGMPALTLWQPWAQFLVEGGAGKWHETRGWPAPRSVIGLSCLIHAAAKVPGELAPVVEEQAEKLWGKRWRTKLAYGAVVGVCIFAEAYPADWRKAVDHMDLKLGHWGSDRWAWRATAALPLQQPVPCPGRQRVWYPAPQYIRAVRANLQAQGAIQ